MSDALSLYLEDMRITKFLFKFYGFDIFSENIEKSFTTYSTITILIFINLSQIYSVNFFKDDFFLLIHSLMTSPHVFLVRS